MKTIDLNGVWKFRAVNTYHTLPRSHGKVTRWMKAEVPGTVHTDLLANRVIPDPFYRLNELDVQWIDSQQWIYRREFNVPAHVLDEDVVCLLAEGLDTYARIMVNGKLAASAENMFVQHEFEVKKYLRKGKNTIEILFDSPVMISKALERKHGRLLVSSEPHRVYVRKAQYSFGWDWGPKLTTSGIWRNISLRAFSHGKLKDPSIKVLSVNKREALLEVSIDVSRWGEQALALRTFIAGEDLSLEQEFAVNAPAMNFQVRVLNPRLWWPNGYGDQPLYHAVFSLLCGGKVIHQLETSFAIRIVKLLQQKDTEGASFILEINGVKIFCKGADWIPSDTFIPRIPDSTYEKLLHLVKDAHMNMVRVWGGGIYEQDVFYSLCDSLGIMVWQDFMYACGEYPQESWLLANAKIEAEKIVRRLRNHPSIVLWCGNNECEWLFCTENPGKTPDDMNGAVIFRDVLPSVCKREDGTRPYWRSSPFGKGFPNAESNGNHHQWAVWSFWKDYKEYAKDNARFVTEFGFQAPANRETFDTVTRLEDRYPQSPVMEHHNKQIEGTERLMRFQAAHYQLGNSYAEFIYLGQLVQAEALKFAVEHWRRRKFRTGGSLYWQLNDCWPVSSWAVVDSALRPKAAYYFTKKFFAPVLVSFRETENGLEVWATNDHLVHLKAKLVVTMRSFMGKKIWSKVQVVALLPNSSKKLNSISIERYSGYGKDSHYLHAELWVDGLLISENRFFFVEPKHLQLSDAVIRTKLSTGKNQRYALTINSNKFVKNVQIRIDGEDAVLSDNYFDVDAGSSKTVTFSSYLKRKVLLKNITVRWLKS
jgi:beta-mannosidase